MDNESTLTLEVKVKRTPENSIDECRFKVFIDGQQLGLLSRVSLEARAHKPLPQITIDRVPLRDGCSKEELVAWEEAEKAIARMLIVCTTKTRRD